MTEERGLTALSSELEIGRLQGKLEATILRQDRDQASNDQRFLVIDGKLNSADAKLDRLLEAQKVAAQLRIAAQETVSENLRIAEKRQEKRGRILVLWATLGSGVAVSVGGELIKHWLRMHGI